LSRGKSPRWRGYGLNSGTAGQEDSADLAEDPAEDPAEASEEEAADLEEVTEAVDMEKASKEALAADMAVKAADMAVKAADTAAKAVSTEAVRMRAGIPEKEGISAEA